MKASARKANRLTRRSGNIISFEEEARPKILTSVKRYGATVDGFLFRKPVLLEEGFDIIGKARELVDSLRLSTPLIADWRIEPKLGPDEISITSDRVTGEGGFGFTIFAIGSPPSFIRKCANQSKTKIFPIIDLGRHDVREKFPDSRVLRLALASRQFGCRWVIMSAKNARRIHKVTEAKIRGHPSQRLRGRQARREPLQIFGRRKGIDVPQHNEDAEKSTSLTSWIGRTFRE